MTVVATSGSVFTNPVSGTPSGVRAYTLNEGGLPLVVEPVEEGIVLADWNATNREWVEAQLLVHGAVLFRNFNLPSPADFERAAKAVYGELFADYGDLPRNAAGEKIYESTPYPADQMILFHNESSHLPSWPTKISFHCVTPAKVGRLHAGVRHARGAEAHRSGGRRGVPYEGAHVRAQLLEGGRSDVGRVLPHDGQGEGRADVPRRRERLRVARRRRAARDQPVEGDREAPEDARRRCSSTRCRSTTSTAWTRRPATGCARCSTRKTCRATCTTATARRSRTRRCSTLGEVFEQVCVRFKWQKGDMIMCDNMLVTHARDTFEGPRQIVVAMGQMMSVDQLPA